MMQRIDGVTAGFRPSDSQDVASVQRVSAVQEQMFAQLLVPSFQQALPGSDDAESESEE